MASTTPLSPDDDDDDDDEEDEDLGSVFDAGGTVDDFSLSPPSLLEAAAEAEEDAAAVDLLSLFDLFDPPLSKIPMIGLAGYLHACNVNLQYATPSIFITEL